MPRMGDRAMIRRWPWLLAAFVVCGCLLVLARGCGRDATIAEPDTADGAPAALPRAGDDAAANADAARRAQAAAYAEAMRSAVDTVHKYLTALGEDQARADAYWSGGAPPPGDSSEADLRTLRDLRALRIENGNPRPLDSQAVPAALEIPVQLRVSLQGAPQRRYDGYYRLRRAISGDRWEITSAAIDALPPRR